MCHLCTYVALAKVHYQSIQYTFDLYTSVQLCSSNAFSTNKFCLNVLSTYTAIYSQFIVNTNNFFTCFYQRKQMPRVLHRIYSDQTDSMRVIRLEVLGLNVLVLNLFVLNSYAEKTNETFFIHTHRSISILQQVIRYFQSF